MNIRLGCSTCVVMLVGLGGCKKEPPTGAPLPSASKKTENVEAAGHAGAIVADLKTGQPDVRKAAVRAVQWLPDNVPTDLTLADLKAVLDLPTSTSDAGAASGMSRQGTLSLAMSIAASRKLVKTPTDAQWASAQISDDFPDSLLSSIGDALASNCEASAGVVWSAITDAAVSGKVDKKAMKRLSPYLAFLRECGGDQAQGALFVRLLDTVVGQARSQVSMAQSSWASVLDREEASETLSHAATLIGATVKLPFEAVEPSLAKLVGDRFLGSTARRMLVIAGASHPEAATRVEGKAGRDAWMLKALAADGKVDDSALPKPDKLPFGELVSLVRMTGSKPAVARLGRKLCERSTDLGDRARALEALLYAQMRLDKPSDALIVPCGFKGKPPQDEAQFTAWLGQEKTALLGLNRDGVAALDASPGAWALPIHLLRIGQANEAVAVLALLQASAVASAEKAMNEAMGSLKISTSTSLSALQASVRRMERANRMLQLAVGVDLKDVGMSVALFGRKGKAIRSILDEALSDGGAQRSKDATPELLRLLATSPVSSDAEFVASLVRAMTKSSTSSKKPAWQSLFTWIDNAEIVKLVKDRCAVGFDSGSVYALSLQTTMSAQEVMAMAKSGPLLCREQAAYALSVKGWKGLRDGLMALLKNEAEPVMKVALHLALARIDG
jgi:hypothetical protein